MDNFCKLFKIPTFFMNITRCNPYIEKNKSWVIQFLIIYVIYTSAFFLIVYNIFCYNLKNNDFAQACKNGVLFVVYIVIMYQYCVLLYHRHGIVVIIEEIKKDFVLSPNLAAEERKVMSVYAQKGVRVCKQWLVVSVCGASVFVVKNVVLFAYYYSIGEPRLVHFYDLTYPDFIERNKDNVFVFSSMYVLLLFFDWFSALMYVAFVPLGLIFMLHACGQMELIKIKVNRVFDGRDDDVTRGKIINIIQHLQYIYSFVERINLCFKMTYELTLKATAVILPVACYEVIESFNGGELSLEFLTFIIGGVMISSSPCYYSDLLMQKGEEVRLSMYSCGWEEHYDLRSRSTLLLMLQRAMRPIAIHTMFRTVSLDALTDLFQQSYAIFNLMTATWK